MTTASGFTRENCFFNEWFVYLMKMRTVAKALHILRSLKLQEQAHLFKHKSGHFYHLLILLRNYPFMNFLMDLFI